MGNTSDHSHANHPVNDSQPDALTGSKPTGSGPEVAASVWPIRLGPTRHVDQRWLHRMNCALVLTCIREHGPITRVKLADMTSLSRATVTMITAELLKEGAIEEGERLPSTIHGGRRAILLYAVAHRGDGFTPEVST